MSAPVDVPSRTTAGRNAGTKDAVWLRYELLKRELTEKATTPAEYDAACRRAAELAGV